MRNRFLIAGLLALGVAACGDDVELITPVPPPPPPPPPLVASMAPASAEVAIGGSVVFAVNASGGVAGEAASWSCSSSNTGIATASATSSGCQATGVAAGGVTITAAVTKGSETANVGSQLTVTAPAAPPPFEASIAPESQLVAVGSSVVFAINASGGYTGMMMDGMTMAASWECSSSDPAIATVETTDSGCQATGVAGGDVTVNAPVTDGHDTINLVAQLTVTTEPVEPTAPFVATMAPESAEVVVESSVVFAINTSGGAADAVASWVCTSSDEAVATASTTDAGCQATGVAGGGVTINAAVTKGEDSASLASQLTVTAPDVSAPAFVFITQVEDEDRNVAEEDATLSGRVEVDVNIERGDHVPESLSLLLDGETVIAHQSFGGIATMAPADEAAQQAGGLVITMSFNSSDYDRETGIPEFMNGAHSVSALLRVVGSDEDIVSNSVPVTLANVDKLNVTLVADGGQAMDSDGLIWKSGAVTASALPVLYDGGTVSQVEFALADADDGSDLISSRGGEDPVDPITDDEAPFEVTWANADASSSDQKRVGGIEPGGIVVHIVSSAFSDGSAGPRFNPMGEGTADKSYFARLDNVGPTIDDFNLALQFNRHYDITRWIGAGHSFTFSSSSQTPDFTDGGVDQGRSSSARYQVANYDYFAGTSTSSVSTVATPNDLDESSNNRAYVIGGTVRDALGNETTRWWNGTAEGMEDDEDDYADFDQTDANKFGVDLTAPTQELIEDGERIGLPAGVISNAAIAAAIATPDRTGRNAAEIDYDDPGSASGFAGSTAPVHTRIRRYAPDLSAEDGCIVGYWRSGDCNILGDPSSNQWRADPAIRGGTSGLYDFMGQEYGYYAVEYAVMDDAGNRAPFIAVGGVLDETEPVGNALVPADREMGERSTLSAFASDNLDLDRVDYFLAFGDDAYQQGSASLGTPSLPFEQSGNASISVETLPGAVGSSTATPTGLSAHVVRIVDQAGNSTYTRSAVTATGDVRNIFTAVPTTHTNVNDADEADGTQTKTITYSEQTIEDDLGVDEALCWDADADGDCDADGEVRATLEFSITATDVVPPSDGSAPTDASLISAEGAPNPFERVVFYVQLNDGDDAGNKWGYLGEGRGRAPTAEDITDGISREFGWRLNVRGSDIAAAAGLVALPEGGNVMIQAVGYTADGNAVTDDTAFTIQLSDDNGG